MFLTNTCLTKGTHINYLLHENPVYFVDHVKFVEKRRWELTNLGVRQQHRPSHGFEFFIMSYNILAQNLLEDNIYLYKETDEHILDWKNRSKKLLLEIKELKAEVMLIFTSQFYPLQ